MTCYEAPGATPPDDPVFDVCHAGDEDCQSTQLIPRIDAESASLDVAIYKLTGRAITEALVRFARTGRPLRLLVDHDHARGRDMRARLRAIRDAGPSGNVAVRSQGASTPDMHLKLAVGRDWLWFGSNNLNDGSTARASGCTSAEYSENNSLVVRDRALRDAAKARFSTLWTSGYFTPFVP